MYLDYIYPNKRRVPSYIKECPLIDHNAQVKPGVKSRQTGITIPAGIPLLATALLVCSMDLRGETSARMIGGLVISFSQTFPQQ
jgi:hypothetical protein